MDARDRGRDRGDAPASTPYDRSPSHHADATPARPIATATMRAVKYDGASCQAWKGACT